MHLSCQPDEAGIKEVLPSLIEAPRDGGGSGGGWGLEVGGAVTTDVVHHGLLLKSRRAM